MQVKYLLDFDFSLLGSSLSFDIDSGQQNKRHDTLVHHLGGKRGDLVPQHSLWWHAPARCEGLEEGFEFDLKMYFRINEAIWNLVEENIWG